MSVRNNPVNENFLSPTGFQFWIKKLPNVNFFIQQANIPSLTLNPVEVNNPLTKISYSGDHIDYGDFNVRFKVDEDLQDYFELFTWVRMLGFSESTEEYETIASQSSWSGNGITSDASLILLNSKKNPNFEFVFMDCQPIYLSELQLNYDVNDIEYVSCDATFRYTTFNMTRIKYGSSEQVVSPGAPT